MDIKLTRVFRDNSSAYFGGSRRALNEGGTSSSKTYSILQLLILIAKGKKEHCLISVVSESLPHLKKGAIRDFFKILGESTDNNPYYNKTDHIYSRPDWKGIIEFFSADDESKVRGPRRDILFINEGNNIPWETARHLDVRTRLFTIVDWNPTGEFWVHEYTSGEDIIPGWIHDKENAYVHSTYLDALHVLPPEVVKNIESNKHDPNWWRVFGLGLLGKMDSLIWPNWEVVPCLPASETWQKWAYGLDFGYTHPVALIKTVIARERLYWDECIYASQLTNSDLIEKLSHEDRADIYADPARPDSIEEVLRAGYNIYAANNRVTTGLDVVRRQKLYITQRSVGLLKEIRYYSYKKINYNGRLIITEEPVKIEDNCCDAGRYGTLGLTERFGFATATGVRQKMKVKHFI